MVLVFNLNGCVNYLITHVNETSAGQYSAFFKLTPVVFGNIIVAPVDFVCILVVNIFIEGFFKSILIQNIRSVELK